MTEAGRAAGQGQRLVDGLASLGCDGREIARWVDRVLLWQGSGLSSDDVAWHVVSDGTTHR